AAEPGIAIEQRRAIGGQAQFVGEIRRPHRQAIALTILREKPVVDPDLGSLAGKAGTAKTAARRALGITQAAQLRVGDGGMGEDQLARREGARVVLAEAGADAEEGALKTQRTAVRQVQPAGGVPPLVAEIRVGAVVAGEFQYQAGADHGELDWR